MTLVDRVQKTLEHAEFFLIDSFLDRLRTAKKRGLILNFNNLIGGAIEDEVKKALKGFPLVDNTHPLLSFIQRNTAYIIPHGEREFCYFPHTKTILVRNTRTEKLSEYDCIVHDGFETVVLEVKFMNLHGDHAARRKRSPLKHIERRVEDLRYFFPSLSYLAVVNQEYCKRVRFDYTPHKLVGVDVTMQDYYRCHWLLEKVKGSVFDPFEKKRT